MIKGFHVAGTSEVYFILLWIYGDER